MSVSEEDAGEYVCMANNHLGSIRHSILVQVKGEITVQTKLHKSCVCCQANLVCPMLLSGSLLAGQAYQPGAGPK